jgi:DNA-binding MarR family transcriptional regulator
MSDTGAMALQMAQNCLWLRVRQASRTLTSVYDAYLEPVGVLASQLTILSAITVFGSHEVGFSQLAEVLKMDKTTLSRNIKPLESAGLVRVARSPADARARILLLTPAGQATVEKGFPLWQQAQRAVQDALAAGDLEVLMQGLGKLAGAQTAC